MHYEGHVIRPPSEADSILLQATVGCSHNECTFCGSYRSVVFRIKDPTTIAADLAEAARHQRHRRRLFLCDGDAITIPQDRLLALLADIREHLPWIERVGCYVSAKALRGKSADDLAALRAAGLKIAYLGLESGDPATLHLAGKDGTVDDIITQGRKVRTAGIKLSVTVLLGLAGRARSRDHAVATGHALSRLQAEQMAALSLMLIPGTPLHDAATAGAFTPCDTTTLLHELRLLLTHIDVPRGLFLADHASNLLPLTIRLPRQKADALTLIDRALDGTVPLRSKAYRRL